MTSTRRSLSWKVPSSAYTRRPSGCPFPGSTDSGPRQYARLLPQTATARRGWSSDCRCHRNDHRATIDLGGSRIRHGKRLLATDRPDAETKEIDRSAWPVYDGRVFNEALSNRFVRFSLLSPVAGAETRGERPERCVGVASRHRQVENCLGVASIVATSGIHLLEIDRHRARRNRWWQRRRRRRRPSRRVRKRTLSRGPSISPSSSSSFHISFSSSFSCLRLFLLLFRGHVDQLEVPSEREHQTRKFFLYASLFSAPLRSSPLLLIHSRSWFRHGILTKSLEVLQDNRSRHEATRLIAIAPKNLPETRKSVQKGNVRIGNVMFALLNASRASKTVRLHCILSLFFSPFLPPLRTRRIYRSTLRKNCNCLLYRNFIVTLFKRDKRRKNKEARDRAARQCP